MVGGLLWSKTSYARIIETSPSVLAPLCWVICDVVEAKIAINRWAGHIPDALGHGKRHFNVGVTHSNLT